MSYQPLFLETPTDLRHLLTGNATEVAMETNLPIPKATSLFKNTSTGIEAPICLCDLFTAREGRQTAPCL